MNEQAQGLDKLLPCPFCGEQYICTDERPGWYEISCPTCGVEMGDITESQCVDAWNRRAPVATAGAVSVPSDVVEAIKDAVTFLRQFGRIKRDALVADKLSQWLLTLKAQE